jgi:hypothetical protein
MIDWTKPVETTEDPPRPVRVLFDRGGRPEAVHINDNHTAPSFNLFAIEHIGAGVNATRGMYSIPLRNVAPPKPKPEPVLREAWVAWDSDGMETIWNSEKDAADRARHLRGVYVRAAVMSDGSPVPGEAPEAPEAPWKENSEYWLAKAENIEKRQEATIKELIRWKQECKSAQAERDALRLDLESRILESNETRKVIAALTAERDDLKAEVERLRTRVDGVEENIDGMGPNGPVLQDCVAGEPVTPCVTCKHYHGGTLAYCSSCSGSNDHTREEMRWTSLI